MSTTVVSSSIPTAAAIRAELRRLHRGEWAAGLDARLHDRFTFGGKLYVVIKRHTTTAGLEPDAAPSYFALDMAAPQNSDALNLESYPGLTFGGGQSEAVQQANHAAFKTALVEAVTTGKRLVLPKQTLQLRMNRASDTLSGSTYIGHSLTGDLLMEGNGRIEITPDFQAAGSWAGESYNYFRPVAGCKRISIKGLEIAGPAAPGRTTTDPGDQHYIQRSYLFYCMDAGEQFEFTLEDAALTGAWHTTVYMQDGDRKTILRGKTKINGYVIGLAMNDLNTGRILALGTAPDPGIPAEYDAGVYTTKKARHPLTGVEHWILCKIGGAVHEQTFICEGGATFEDMLMISDGSRHASEKLSTMHVYLGTRVACSIDGFEATGSYQSFIKGHNSWPGTPPPFWTVRNGSIRNCNSGIKTLESGPSIIENVDFEADLGKVGQQDFMSTGVIAQAATTILDCRFKDCNNGIDSQAIDTTDSSLDKRLITVKNSYIRARFNHFKETTYRANWRFENTNFECQSYSDGAWTATGYCTVYEQSIGGSSLYMRGCELLAASTVHRGLRAVKGGTWDVEARIRGFDTKGFEINKGASAIALRMRLALMLYGTSGVRRYDTQTDVHISGTVDYEKEDAAWNGPTYTTADGQYMRLAPPEGRGFRPAARWGSVVMFWANTRLHEIEASATTIRTLRFAAVPQTTYDTGAAQGRALQTSGVLRFTGGVTIQAFAPASAVATDNVVFLDGAASKAFVNGDMIPYRWVPDLPRVDNVGVVAGYGTWLLG